LESRSQKKRRSLDAALVLFELLGILLKANREAKKRACVALFTPFAPPDLHNPRVTWTKDPERVRLVRAKLGSPSLRRPRSGSFVPGLRRR
jgi:hypothetical protein